jgi:hypothetical protein
MPWLALYWHKWLLVQYARLGLKPVAYVGGLEREENWKLCLAQAHYATFVTAHAKLVPTLASRTKATAEKVKCSISLNEEWRSGDVGTGLRILKFVSIYRRAISLTPRPLHPLKGSLDINLIGGCVGPRDVRKDGLEENFIAMRNRTPSSP